MDVNSGAVHSVDEVAYDIIALYDKGVPREEIIDEIKEEEVIVYQGYLQNTEELLEIAKALKEFKKKYKFVLMGIDQYNSVEKIKEVYNNCVFYPYIPAPMHLEITSYAKIGILFYRPTILNNAYCAPNKIFEYGGNI